MRTMGDATTLANIPLSVQLVGCYRNGRYMADPNYLNTLFPVTKYVHVWIDIDGSCPQSAQVLDVERYDADPSQAPGWVKARRAVVHTSLPTIYVNRSQLPDVQSACHDEGLKSGTDYHLWIATLDGSVTLDGTPGGRPLVNIPGVVAVQVETGAWDRSIVYNDKWHPLAA